MIIEALGITFIVILIGLGLIALLAALRYFGWL